MEPEQTWNKLVRQDIITDLQNFPKILKDQTAEQHYRDAVIFAAEM